MDQGLIIANFVFGLIAGGICAAIAHSKGRNPFGWYCGGFFLGLIGIIIIACLSNLKQAAIRRGFENRNRRTFQSRLQEARMETAVLESQMHAQQPAAGGLDALPEVAPTPEETPRGYEPPSALDELARAVSDR